MTIVKHRTVDLPLEEIMKAAAAHKPPKGMAIDITEETITIGPEGTINLFGLVGPDYEMVYYEE